jgi:small-conductance mechanosensitive channel
VPHWVPDALATVVVVVVAWVLSRVLVRVLNRRIARRLQRPSLTRTVLSGIRVAVFVLAFLLILRIHGLNLGNIALSVTVFTAVLGVVLAPIVGSVISGIFLLADQPYEIGDMVELVDRDTRGFVEDITLRYTKIFTLDNTFLVIPNGTIRDRDVINYSAEDPRTRLSLPVLVTYESDRERAQRRIEEAARSVDRVIEGGPDIRIGSARYPAAPSCLVASFADNGVLLRLRYWVTEPYRIPTIKSEVQEAVDDAIAEIDAEFAYPHTHHVFDETSGTLQVGEDTHAPGEVSGGSAGAGQD